MRAPLFLLLILSASLCAEPLTFDTRSAKSGPWSEAATWGGKLPKAGERVQVRTGHVVTYDIAATDAFRLLHVAGTLNFSRQKNTRLEVGLIKVEPGETTTEDGFNCHEETSPVASSGPRPVLEIGTADRRFLRA